MPAPISLEVKRFIDWLYEVGPDPMSMTRARFLGKYQSWVDQGAVLRDAFADERLGADTDGKEDRAA